MDDSIRLCANQSTQSNKQTLTNKECRLYLYILGLSYREAWLVTLYLIVSRIIPLKIIWIRLSNKRSDDQTNIEKYGVTANITEYHIISK